MDIRELITFVSDLLFNLSSGERIGRNIGEIETVLDPINIVLNHMGYNKC